MGFFNEIGPEYSTVKVYGGSHLSWRVSFLVGFFCCSLINLLYLNKWTFADKASQALGLW
jgi:hypothetical protein